MAVGPGDIIGDYRVESLLGRGGMGVVWAAVEERLERRVALKVLAPEVAADATFRDRFLRESRAAASLDHPHVIPIYGAGEVDGELFLAMRLVPGGTDLEDLFRSGALTPETTIAIVTQVAGALEAAHRIGLVHRDVKPANILVVDSPEGSHAYLSDFGLTRSVGQQRDYTRTGQLLGTVEYVAPEQVAGGPVDHRADVYSLACVAWEGLAGTPPFHRETDIATLYAHVHLPPPSLRDVRPELPPRLADALARGLAKDPDLRTPSAGELARELGRAIGRDASSNASPAVAGESPARPPDVPALVSAPPRSGGTARRPGRRRLAAVAVVLLLVAGLAAWWTRPWERTVEVAFDESCAPPAGDTIDASLWPDLSGLVAPPIGETIGFLRETTLPSTSTTSSLVRVGTDGTELGDVAFPSTSGPGGGPAWAQDGHATTFWQAPGPAVSDPSETLVAVQPGPPGATSGLAVMAAQCGFAREVAWSPDGQRLLLPPKGQPGFERPGYVADLTDPGVLDALALADPQDDGYQLVGATWRPDGRITIVAEAIDEEGILTGYLRVGQAAADGSDARLDSEIIRVTLAGTIAWDPTGSTLLLVVDDTFGTRMIVLPATGSSFIPLPVTEDPSTDPVRPGPRMVSGSRTSAARRAAGPTSTSWTWRHS